MKIENSQSILSSPLKLCRSFPTVSVRFWPPDITYILHIPRRESNVQVILTLNHYPGGPENSIYVDILFRSSHRVVFILNAMPALHSHHQAAKNQFLHIHHQDHITVNSCFTKRCSIFYFECILWSEAMFFNFMIALSSTSSSHGD